jgi:cytidylate kinase
MLPSLIILRGLPGSGKSTLAKLISEKGKYPVYCIDDYFTNAQGEYHFKFDENHLAYKSCEENVRNAMKDKTEKIILDNVFSLEWEMEPYFKMAAENKYAVHVATVENRHGNKNMHEIGDEQVKKMAAKFKVKLI